jgi:hypothetical protein
MYYFKNFKQMFKKFPGQKAVVFVPGKFYQNSVIAMEEPKCLQIEWVRLMGAMTFSVMTLSIKGLYVTLSINETEPNRHSA